jgi:uncharacterized protein (TIGR00251 family)
MLESHPQGLVLSIRAQPGAKRTGICGKHGDLLKVAVTQAAEKGKATAAILHVLADALGLRRSQLELLSGQTSRTKRVLVQGIDAAELTQRIDASIGAAARSPRESPTRDTLRLE